MKQVDVRPVYEDGETIPSFEVDKADIEWADVILLRRYYNTTFKCKTRGCGFLTMDPAVAHGHEHPAPMQDNITRIVWPAIRDSWTGGIIYETDDDHFNVQPWNGYYKDVLAERPLITEMARRADLVTVSTPLLALRYGRFNKNTRVIRNALDFSFYERDAERPALSDKVRLVYYGSAARLRDYAGYPNARGKWEGGYAKAAVDAHQHLLWRVFSGTSDGLDAVVARMFDEDYPYIEDDLAGFAKRLANLHGDIGIAPLLGDDFDAAKSELHWMEYAATGMAFIGERFKRHGPYEVVRDGVDGLLARGAQEWHDAVGKLAKSKDLREQLAGAALERVRREYDYRDRVAEWADAFRWAAEHPRGAIA